MPLQNGLFSLFKAPVLVGLRRRHDEPELRNFMRGAKALVQRMEDGGCMRSESGRPYELSITTIATKGVDYLGPVS